MSETRAVLNEFMPCGGTICPDCEDHCPYGGRTADAFCMADAIIALRDERDALRQVDDAMVWRAMRAFSATAEKEGGFIAVYGKNWMRAALDAALAVQPTTGAAT